MGRRDLSLSLLCEDRVKGQSFTSQEDDVDQDQEANIPEPGPWTSHSLEQEKKSPLLKPPNLTCTVVTSWTHAMFQKHSKTVQQFSKLILPVTLCTSTMYF